MKRIESRAVTASWKLYGRLLAIYPRKYRREFGPAMAQLFRDQCRDAWSASRVWGLAKLWFRVLLDLIKTSVLEHFTNLKGEQTMWQTINGIIRFRSAPSVAFVVVFLTVAGGTTLVTLLMPKVYTSTSRMKVSKTDAPNAYDPYVIQTEFEVMQSPAVLDTVIRDLGLQAKWGQQYSTGKLSMDEARQLLVSSMEIRPVRNTALMEINIRSQDTQEAALIANAIARSYDMLTETRPGNVRVQIVDLATPDAGSPRPNLVLNLMVGTSAGFLLGGLLAGAFYLLGKTRRENSGNPFAVTISERIIGAFWSAFGMVCAYLFLAAVIERLGTGTFQFNNDNVLRMLFGSFFAGLALGGFLLFRGKAWTRIPLGAVSAILASIVIVTFLQQNNGLSLRNFNIWQLIVDAFLLFWITSAVILLKPRHTRPRNQAT